MHPLLKSLAARVGFSQHNSGKRNRPPPQENVAPKKIQKPSGQPSIEEIAASIEAAGYPFEIRVANRLEQLGMHPLFGQRLRVSPTETKEIDVQASHVVAWSISDPPRSNVFGYLALVQAKKIHDAAFVGFRVEPTDSYEGYFLNQARMGSVAGVPSWNVLGGEYDRHGELMYRLNPAFDPFNRDPLCMQWTVAKRNDKKEGLVFADHDQGTYEDLETMVRASVCHVTDVTSIRLRAPKAESAIFMQFVSMALVLDCPLFVFDPTRPDAKPVSVPSLILDLRIETQYGVQSALVDVLSFSALDNWTKRYSEAGAILRPLLDETGDRLAVVGRAQQEAFIRDSPPM